MSNLSYEDAKKHVFKGFWILLVITLFEVVISLLGKGYMGDVHYVVFVIAALVIIGLSLFKAKYIIYEFMHMSSEMKGLRLSVLLPMALLIWAVIAFFQEGSYWKNSRALIEEKDKIEVNESTEMQGYRLEEDVYELKELRFEG